MASSSTESLTEKRPNSLQPIERLNVDGFLRMVGEFGRFQWILDMVFCLMIIPGTFQILIMYFAAQQPDWKCVTNSTVCTLNGTFTSENEARCHMPRSEWEFTEPKEYSIVTTYDIYCDRDWAIFMSTSIMFIGWLFGAIFMGWLADNYGRKKVLFLSITINLVVSLITPFMPMLVLFLLCRFIVGFVTPGGIQMFVLISEIVGNKYRPAAGIVLWFFFTFGLCLMGLKAYLIRKWKTLFIVCTAPYFVVLLFYNFVPESVRWLRLKGKLKEALEIFQRIADWNGRKMNPNARLTAIHDTRHKSNPIHLFRNKRVAIKTFVQGYAWMVNGMVYYGISLTADALGGSIHLNYVLVSVIEFPAAIFAIRLSQSIGRRKTTSVSMLLAGVLTLVVAFIPLTEYGKPTRVIIGMLGKMFVTISFDSIFTWSTELYPTDIRSEALGLLQITSRIGAAAAPWIAKSVGPVHDTLPFVIMGVLGLTSGITTFFLPETKGKETAETENDITDEVFFLNEMKEANDYH